ncbi:MAG: oligosaccharide flippase family protein [Deltaproteobacteria bacterium]|nr:oligosaccharide flippase family protein [Deltaproteobacteria bacterium]
MALVAKRRLARGTLFSIAARVGYLGCGYAIYVLIGRVLGPKEYGIIGVVFSLLNFFYIFLKNGLPQATSKYIGGEALSAYPVLRTAMKIQLGWGLLLFLIAFGGGKIMSVAVLNDIELSPYLRLASITLIPLAVYAIYEAALVGVRDFFKSALGMALTSIVRLVLVCAALALGFGIDGVLGGYVLAAIVGTFVVKSFCHFPQSERAFDGKKILSFALPLAITGGVMAILMNIDSILVKRIMGSNVQVGFYFSAATLAHALFQVFGTFGITLLPSIAYSVGNGDYELTRKYVRQVLRYILLISIPIASVISATSTELVTLIYGDAFREAGSPLSILIWGSSLFGLSAAMNTAISAMDHPWMAILFYILPVILIVPVSLLCISQYGLAGAAGAILAVWAVSLIFSVTYLHKKLHGIVDWLSVCRVCFAGVITYFLGLNFHVSGLLLLGYYALLLIVNGVIVFSLGEWHREDLEVLKGIFRGNMKVAG